MARCVCTLSTDKDEHALFVQRPGIFSRLQVKHGSCWTLGATRTSPRGKQKQTNKQTKMNPHSIQAGATSSPLLNRSGLWQPSWARAPRGGLGWGGVGGG